MSSPTRLLLEMLKQTLKNKSLVAAVSERMQTNWLYMRAQECTPLPITAAAVLIDALPHYTNTIEQHHQFIHIYSLVLLGICRFMASVPRHTLNTENGKKRKTELMCMALRQNREDVAISACQFIRATRVIVIVNLMPLLN